MEVPFTTGSRKRALPSSPDEPTHRLEITDAADTQAASSSRSRNATACVKCRHRKTRCDNQRPSCGYCLKHDVECVYDEGTSNPACVAANGQLLNAIEKLSAKIDRNYRCSSCSRDLIHGAVSQDVPFETLYEARPSPSTWVNEGVLLERSSAVGPFGKVVQPTFHFQGVESILKWSPFTRIPTEGCLFAGGSEVTASTASLPSADYNELCRLRDKYVEGVQSKNPILDMEELDTMMLLVAENGYDWSTKTCLVTLVCAIGALNQPYQDSRLPPAAHLKQPPESQLVSLQYWNVAVKRLGSAIGQADLEAAQCLCLAGIWYMYQMEPLQAWKYFTLAGSVWYSVSLLHGTAGSQASHHPTNHSVTVSQALYFTIWKSTCEIRLEIDVPGIFDNVGLPHDFPQTPGLGRISPALDGNLHSSSERYWFYYLAEIAARHQINRIASAIHWKDTAPSGKEIRQMLMLADILLGNLHEWHASLPAMLTFDIPVGYEIALQPDHFVQILRHRYLTCTELICRPFLRLCVETTLAYEETMRARIIELASVCLQFCMLKLSQIDTHRHQGTWFGLRSVLSSTLLLCSVSLAHQNTGLPEAHHLKLPNGWQAKALRAAEVLSDFWSEERGGAINIGRLVHAALAAATSDSEQPENIENWREVT